MSTQKTNILDLLLNSQKSQLQALQDKVRDLLGSIVTLIMTMGNYSKKPLKFTAVEEFSLPETILFDDTFLSNLKNVEISPDDLGHNLIDFLLKLKMTAISKTFSGGEKYYIYKTTEENSHDCQIVSAFEVDSLINKEELLILAAYIIMLDLRDEGPLHNLSLGGQENLNLPYLNDKDAAGSQIVESVWLERLKPTAEGKRHYHLHFCPFPREYKKADRHFMERIN